MYRADRICLIKAFFSNANIAAPEVRRGLNSVFANDLVPDVSILTAALKATRRTNDFATYATRFSTVNRSSIWISYLDRSVRIFEGIKDKTQDEALYQSVVAQLKGTIEELGLSTPEELNLHKA